jgi:hypothetical protein
MPENTITVWADGVPITVTVAVGGERAEVVTAGPPDTGGAVHSPDFASVRWRGQVFAFTPKQRLIVAALWHARQQGYEWVSTESLLEAAESNGGRVRELFKGHPAWGTLIISGVVAGGCPGTYRWGE